MESKSNPEKTAKTSKGASSNIIKKCFDDVVCIVKKPVTGLKDKIKDYTDPKNAGIIAGFSIIATLIVGLVGTIFSRVVTKSTCSSYAKLFGKTSECGQISVNWSNLDGINWFELIFETLLMYVVMAAIISGATFLVSRIMKTKAKSYWQVLALSSIVLLPIALGGLVGSILGLAWSTLYILCSLVAVAFALFVFFEGVNDLFEIEGDKKVFFHVINLIVVVAAIWVYYRLRYNMDLGELLNISSLLGM